MSFLVFVSCRAMRKHNEIRFIMTLFCKSYWSLTLEVLMPYWFDCEVYASKIRGLMSRLEHSNSRHLCLVTIHYLYIIY